ncbi:2-oxo-4-hydroxy-4-carboxy-5-ureidoimidazoline decarboxylase [Azospirillum sp.]|uniref:2-oxo-4-hydroxy-4-carboxy-5-ureidoimidazoline decarboxylase n=1 Tax=Azospirillum sp. TaxID=34012 RepID=UPI002D50B7DB|nr:2-oxo-4-hydroxy-4-carboxy-5-ureidoimidazoline decarboxylase [Azospirillum sp.]HYD69243.1 2-oxo-4-hydroxy-4-carboxy-5-ureidoimidazoline decarboxylase [Azospirillum sp.]
MRRTMESGGMDRAAFVARFGGVFEHSPWIAEGAWDAGLPEGAGTADGLHAAMVAVLRAAPHQRKLDLLNAHPDLAGKLAVRGELTAESSAEQAGAGLDRCTPAEFARFTELNDTYKVRFGFPFILAVKGSTRAEILAAFERRVTNTPEEEFATALEQVERIALLRIRDLLPATP